jgi:nudix-type nucleoside diphosphatase (YffH/AdpP family)
MRKVEILEEGLVFDRFFKIKEARLRFEKFSGEMSEPMQRLSFERGDSVAVLILRREAQRVILVNQFKYPTHGKGPGWIVEVTAGAIDPGETPEAAIRREVLEETGFSVTELVSIATFYVSPGGSSERIFLFFAEVDDSLPRASGGGNPAEGEDIEVIELSLPELWQGLRDGRFIDAKTLVAVLWLKDRLGGAR